MAEPLTAADIERAAELLGVEPAAIRAVDAVESRGTGFLPDGRPLINYERHVMYRMLKKAGRDADALAARYPGIVNPVPGVEKYGAAEWYSLGLAKELSPALAYQSASWGRYQIMGFHWKLLGYESPSAFVAAMSESEAAQLEAFCRFIEADTTLHQALKDRDWKRFARIYNGPGYKANAYDVKLAAAYDAHTGALA